MWSLPDGRKLTAPDHIDASWGRVVPLTDDMNGPLALNRAGMIGLALPRSGQAPPLRRLADAVGAPSPHADDLMDRLCALLADPNNDKAVHDLVPQDASEEPLCPS
jgi:hypothetical protein